MCSPLLFKVFLRPSFGACAPPSPNSARNLYFLRQVGRLLMIVQASRDLSRRLAPLSPKGKAFSQSVMTFNDNSGRRRPLSAPCATLPKGESFLFRRFCANLPEGESFPQSGKTFCFFDSAFESKRQKVFPLGGYYHDFSAKLGEMPSPQDVVINRN